MYYVLLAAMNVTPAHRQKSTHFLITFLSCSTIGKSKNASQKILYLKIKNKKIARGVLTLVLVMTPPLLLQETATGLQHCLQSTQTPVIVLLGSQQLPGQTNKATFSHIHTRSEWTVLLDEVLTGGRRRITYPQNQYNAIDCSNSKYCIYNSK